jgi:hypothetical protein
VAPREKSPETPPCLLATKPATMDEHITTQVRAAIRASMNRCCGVSRMSLERFWAPRSPHRHGGQ